ncbi:MAG: hypothetical protein RLY93_07105 [Sumerlaeia bacterium]
MKKNVWEKGFNRWLENYNALKESSGWRIPSKVQKAEIYRARSDRA